MGSRFIAGIVMAREPIAGRGMRSLQRLRVREQNHGDGRGSALARARILARLRGTESFARWKFLL